MVCGVVLVFGVCGSVIYAMRCNTIDGMGQVHLTRTEQSNGI